MKHSIALCCIIVSTMLAMFATSAAHAFAIGDDNQDEQYNTALDDVAVIEAEVQTSLPDIEKSMYQPEEPDSSEEHYYEHEQQEQQQQEQQQQPDYHDHHHHHHHEQEQEQTSSEEQPEPDHNEHHHPDDHHEHYHPDSDHHHHGHQPGDEHHPEQQPDEFYWEHHHFDNHHNMAADYYNTIILGHSNVVKNSDVIFKPLTIVAGDRNRIQMKSQILNSTEAKRRVLSEFVINQQKAIDSQQKYYFSSYGLQKETWVKALAACHSHGMKMATFVTPAQYVAFVESLRATKNDGQYWLGIVYNMKDFAFFPTISKPISEVGLKVDNVRATHHDNCVYADVSNNGADVKLIASACEDFQSNRKWFVCESYSDKPNNSLFKLL